MMKRSKTTNGKPVWSRRAAVVVLAIVLMIEVGAPSSAWSRGFELTAFGGGILGGKADARLGRLNLIDGFSYGATLGVNFAGPSPVSPQVEFYYKRQDSELEFRSSLTGTKFIISDISTHYMMLGVLRPLVYGDAVVYGVGSAGMVCFNPKSSEYDAEWMFAAGAGLGTKILSRSGRFGFRFDARLLIPIEWGSGYIFCGSGGCNTGLSGGVMLVQVDLSGGIIVAF